MRYRDFPKGTEVNDDYAEAYVEGALARSTSRTPKEGTMPAKRMVRGIKPGIAIVEHVPEETGFASIRSFTFDTNGQPTVTVLELSRNEAIDIAQALAELLDA